jgi:hypothetical protein
MQNSKPKRTLTEPFESPPPKRHGHRRSDPKESSHKDTSDEDDSEINDDETQIQ